MEFSEKFYQMESLYTDRGFLYGVVIRFTLVVLGHKILILVIN